MGIRLVPHDPEWADIYERTAADIRDALGGTALSIDHVGSTAIPGIDSKPVIDILVLVKSYDPEEAYRMPLESLGYVFEIITATRYTPSSKAIRRAWPPRLAWRRSRRRIRA
jgi:GrpB-like predicted nucleotidyltransferase (UPF0157 family)